MSIEIKCNCGSEYRLDDNRAGEKFTCKVCGTKMMLPAGVGRATAAASRPAQTAAAATQATPSETVTSTQTTPEGGSLLEMGSDLQTPIARTTDASGLPAADAPEIGRTVTPGFQAPVDDASTGKRRPPMAWCVGRLVMWGMCVGFLFMPWFSRSGSNPETGAAISESITGWQIVKGVCEGTKIPLLNDFTNVPNGAGRVVAGGGMIVFSPLIYAVGLALILIFAPVAWSREGSGAVWPFVAGLGGLLSFIIGWHLVAGASPFKQMLDIASQVGVSIGISGWAYAMAIVLVPLCLIARGKPNFHLVHAIRWSQEQTNTGPL